MLDDLEDAVQCRVESWPENVIGELKTLAHALYFIQSEIGGLISSQAKSVVCCDDYSKLARHMLQGRRGVFTNDKRTWGIAGAEESGQLADELSQFALSATKRTSLPLANAHQVVSALGEFHSNIVEHSGDATRSFVGFEVSERFIGIYATDFGFGPLGTLSRNPRYQDLADAGESLRLIIQDGVTCTGEPGRGLGFRPIFEGLANRSGYLRFRSGDSLLEISGIRRDRPSMQLKQRPTIDGFHVFVHCQL